MPRSDTGRSTTSIVSLPGMSDASSALSVKNTPSELRPASLARRRGVLSSAIMVLGGHGLGGLSKTARRGIWRTDELAREGFPSPCTTLRAGLTCLPSHVGPKQGSVFMAATSSHATIL
uniref:Uncharacterized protein n=1 Tax=Pinguiococcus pyrenoidosus TaxID=172671 RepID=A0A7R9YDD6_9STRA